MSVDFEAIAQRGRCDVSSLRLALPLLEQGYTPPFLARYRRDELGGLDEASLWALSDAVQSERAIAERRDHLHEIWEQTPLQDPAIGHAIKKSNSIRMLTRLGRRLKREESGDNINDATRLAVRVLNPQKGDGADFASIAAKIEGLTEAEAAVAGLNESLAKRLAGDPRIIGAAVRWLAKNARIGISDISDPHIGGEANSGKESASKTETASSAAEAAAPTEEKATETPAAEPPVAKAATTPAETTEPVVAAEPTEPVVASEPTEAVPAIAEPAAESTATPPADTAPSEPATAEPTASTEGDAATVAAPAAETTVAEPGADATAEVTKAAAPAAAAKGSKKKADSKQPKKQKKVSPRQRRRRWLVGVLKPLEGKRLNSDKLSSFQIVMLSRALRSQVAKCSFDYDATKLVAELQRTAGGINRHVEQQLQDAVLSNEAAIREAAEAAWWEDLQERASARLVSITADHLRQQVNRGGVEANVVMAIDAVGPRTAATTIVAADGRVLHGEDIPCQLSAAQRSQAVAKMGELIHTYHVDLVVVSNGPARRATMIALGDLIGQAPDQSVRWTVADRSGADAYAGSAVADQEMRSTPRRFRAAAWLAFSILQPAQALAKVDPLKLRLSSFQRELADEAMLPSLQDVMVSGASRGGVDVNSAPATWLAKLPGMNAEVAAAVDSSRRKSLFSSREMLSALEQWDGSTQSRQAIPFLRVFGSDEELDGTLIHPEDYALARKLAKSLDIELPPNAPPGYTAPDFSAEPTEPTRLTEAQAEPEKPIVEDFTAAGQQASEFAVEAPAEPSEAPAEPSEAASVTSEVGVTKPADAAEPAVPTETTEEAEAASSPTENENDTPEPTAEATAESTADASEAASTPEPEAATTPEVATSESEATPDPAHEQIKRPKPERAKIDKCVKEWQIGAKRAEQLVSWLCDPFGDSDISGTPPAVLSTMPTISTLKEGDVVIGVVVGVMPFGVFVELAPDCSGLIHVSRVSETFVDDLHEAVQVGDVVTAWVTGIDNKRRRVALSAVSPQREAELAEQRQQARANAGPRGGRGQARGGGQGRGQARGAKPSSSTGGGGGQPARGGDQARGKPTGRPQGRGKDQRGRGSRDQRGGRGKGRDRKLESYRVVGQKEAKPISEDMQQGKEPLRSFGDLMQFFGTDAEKAKEKPKPKQKQAKKKPADPAPEPKPPTADSSSEDSPASEPPATPPTNEAPPAAESSQETSADDPKPDATDSSPADAST
ncbi:MAG: S1 RNA-binding domain-containing protein [Rubripirellula sp.]